MTTPILRLPELTPSTAERVLTNTVNNQLEAFCTKVQDFLVGTPPLVIPAHGYKAILDGAPTGIWAAYPNHIVLVVVDSYIYIPPSIFLIDQESAIGTNNIYRWNGSAWIIIVAGSGGLTWETSTISTSLAVNTGYFLNSNNLEHTLPVSALLGKTIEIIGVNLWKVTSSGLIYLPNGSSNTGIKSNTGFPRSTALFRSLGGADWMAVRTEGAILYAVPTGGGLGAAVAENYRIAELAQGYTVTPSEIAALTDYVNALNTAGVWDTTGKTFALYPLLGTTKAQQQINLVTPGTGDLANLDGTLTHNSNGFTGDGTIYAGTTFMDMHWTNINFRTMFAAFSNLPSGTTGSVLGVEGFTSSYFFTTTQIKLGIHNGNNEISATPPISFPFSGIIGLISRASGSNVTERPYFNGTVQSDTPSSARGAHKTDLRMLRCNSVPSPPGTICKGFICIKSDNGLTDSNATAINTAFTTFLTAIGR
jgi:hypothetical protein